MQEKPATGRIPRSVLAMLVVIVGVGGALRFWNLGGPSYWTDELYSVAFTRMPQPLLWSDWILREPNPPLYYSLLHAWVRLFGEGEQAVRSLSAILACFGIVAVFLIARALRSNTAGLLAAIFAGCAAHQLQFAQESRAYMLAFVAAALAILALVGLTNSWMNGVRDWRRTWPHLLLYALSTSIAFNSHTTLVILPLLANAYMGWLWLARTPRSLRDGAGWLIANALVLILCGWWLWMTVRQMTADLGPIAWITQPTLKEAVAKTTHLFATRGLDSLNLPLAALSGGLIAFGAWRLPLEKRVLVATFGIGVPAIVYLIGFAQPIFQEKTLLWAQAVYLPCLAIGILSLPIGAWRAAAAAICVLVLLADTVILRRREYHEPWREIASMLRDQTTARDAILLYDTDAGVHLDTYARRLGGGQAVQLALPARPGKTTLNELFQGRLVEPRDLRDAVQSFDRIWVLQRGVGRGFDADTAEALHGIAEPISPDLLATSALKGVAGGNTMRLSIWRATPAVRTSGQP